MRVQVPVVAAGVSRKTVEEIVKEMFDGILGGADGSYGPLWNATLENGLVKSASNYQGSVAHQTLRWNGTTWVYTSFLKTLTGRSGVIDQVLIGNPASPGTATFEVHTDSASTPAIIRGYNSGANPSGLNVGNTQVGCHVAIAGGNGNWGTNWNAGDCGILSDQAAKQIHFTVGTNTNSQMKMDATGLGIGLASTTIGAKVHVVSVNGTIGLLFTHGASPTVDYFNFQDGSAASKLKLNSTGQLIHGGLTPIASLYGAVIAGAFEARRPTSAGVIVATTDTFQNSGATIAQFNGGAFVSSTAYNGFKIAGVAAENQDATHNGCDISFAAVKKVATAFTNRLRISSEGNIVLNDAQVALATSATDGFTHIPSMAGLATGSITTYTGNKGIHADSSNVVLNLHYTGSTHLNVAQLGKVTAVTTTYTVLPTDHTIKATTSGSNYTITLPVHSTIPIGWKCWIKVTSNAFPRTITVAPGSGATCNNGGASPTSNVEGQVFECELISTSEWEISKYTR